MKTMIASLWLPMAVLAAAAEPGSAASTNEFAREPMLGPRGSILGVMRGPDKGSLVIHYEFAGRTNQQTVRLTNDIAEFHFCSWVGGRGIALAIEDTSGGVHWAAGY